MVDPQKESVIGAIQRNKTYLPFYFYCRAFGQWGIWQFVFKKS